jgi:hypothetical protein
MKMKPITEMLDMTEYLKKRETALDAEVKRRGEKYDRNKNRKNMVMLCSSLGSAKEVKRIMMRVIGYHLKDLDKLASEK